MITNEAIAQILENVLQTSVSSEWYDDDIQPSKRRHYDGDKIANQIQVLVQVLKLEGNK